MTRMTLAAFALIITTLPASAETNWTRTGPNGGRAAGQVTCTLSGTTRTCDGQGTFTGPKGQVATRQSHRIATPDQVTVTATGTGPRGKTVTTTRIRSR